MYQNTRGLRWTNPLPGHRICRSVTIKEKKGHSLPVRLGCTLQKYMCQVFSIEILCFRIDSELSTGLLCVSHVFQWTRKG
jgi:hypothetical protein